MARYKKIGLSPLFKENLDVALKAIRSNKLRSILTILIIAIGITSLVGVLTATDALKGEIFSGFEKMGANTFTIESNNFQTKSQKRERIRNKNNISYYQAIMFKEKFDMPAVVSIFTELGFNIVAKYENESTSPNINLVAADEDFVKYSNITIVKGRGFSKNDINSAAYVCVIGQTTVNSLFKKIDPIDKIITVSGVRYRVIGISQSVGNTFNGGVDSKIIIPVSNARSYFMSNQTSFTIGVLPEKSSLNSNNIYDRAEQVFRSVRRLSPYDNTDFIINRSDAQIEEMTEIMDTVTIASIVIGMITLLGAAVGLMNIMLVSVKERTREIGTRKAIGASSKRIKQQFLIESVAISQIGCIVGIIIGITIGNVTAMLMKASFVIPWVWMLLAIIICVIVGIASGYIPAVRASKLDPIEALRYE